MVEPHYDSRPIGTQVRCIDTGRGAPLLMFGAPHDVCAAEGCDTELRGSNPTWHCALHEIQTCATRGVVPLRERRKKEPTDVSRRHAPPLVPAVHPDHGDDEMTTKDRILQMITEANGAFVERPDDIPKGTWASSVCDLRKNGYKIVSVPGPSYGLETNDSGDEPAQEALPVDETQMLDHVDTPGAAPHAKVKARSDVEWTARASYVLDKTAWPTLYECLAALLAGENVTGRVKTSRVVNELYDPLWVLEEMIGAGAMEKGLRAAIKAGAPNATYVEKAAHGYKPAAKKVDVAAGGSEWELKDGQSYVVMTLAEFEALTQGQPMTAELCTGGGDPEVNAIAAIADALAELPDTARRRVLEYAAVRYVTDNAA